MRRVLNTHTNTVHRAIGDDGSLETPCGSLLHVPRSRARPVTEAELRSLESVDRCGNCFEGEGGY